MGKETLIPNYIKKGKFKKKIPVKIIERVSYGYYRIKIYVDYKDKKIKFYNGKLLIADSKLLKLINVKAWESIVNAHSN